MMILVQLLGKNVIVGYLDPWIVADPESDTCLRYQGLEP